MLGLLLAYGADPNQRDANKDCPLIFVAQSMSLCPSRENRDMMKILLEHGADITQVGT